MLLQNVASENNTLITYLPFLWTCQAFFWSQDNTESSPLSFQSCKIWNVTPSHFLLPSNPLFLKCSCLPDFHYPVVSFTLLGLVCAPRQALCFIISSSWLTQLLLPSRRPPPSLPNQFHFLWEVFPHNSIHVLPNTHPSSGSKNKMMLKPVT